MREPVAAALQNITYVNEEIQRPSHDFKVALLSLDII